ncbi:MAG: B12-binding domain-containing radical SAM protein [Polyangiaceae bacterium]|nr:B12-binding domain-containing radical SAM protein [Polyangiaceae bacterium]
MLGLPTRDAGPDAPKLLFVKARIEDHVGEASAPAQAPMLLGAVARQRGWEVRTVDAYLEADPAGAVAAALARFPATVVGMTALTAEYRSLHELARVARRARPSAVVLAGGAHASADPDDVLANEAIDAAVIGEGERTLEEVLDRVRAESPWRDAAGLAVRGPGGRVVRARPRPVIEELDSLPFPAWDLTDVDAYAKLRGMSLTGLRRYMPLTTSRGCPYRCTYCHDIQGKRFRAHSAEYVLRMIDELRARHGVHHFDLTDDIFNFDPERMLAICDGLIARGPGIGFTCPNGVRGDRLTVEQADRMARAGCEYVAIAIETATPRLQKQIKKNLRFDKVQPIIAAFTERNVFTAGFFMVGFPTETEAELRATIDYAVRSKLHAAFFFVVTPFAGTDLHEHVVEGMGRAAAELTGSGFYFRPVENLSQVPQPRFDALRREAYLRFYLDPRRMARIWRAYPRKLDLAEYASLMLVRDALRIDPGRVLGPLSRALTRAREALAPARQARAEAAPPRATRATAAAPTAPHASSPAMDERRRLPLA